MTSVNCLRSTASSLHIWPDTFLYNLTPSFILPTSMSYTFHLIISPNHFCELTTTVLLRLALFSGILPKWNGSTKEAHGSTWNCFIQARHHSCQQNNSLKSLKKAQSSNSKQEKSPTDLILYWHTEISDGKSITYLLILQIPLSKLNMYNEFK